MCKTWQFNPNIQFTASWWTKTFLCLQKCQACVKKCECKTKSDVKWQQNKKHIENPSNISIVGVLWWTFQKISINSYRLFGILLHKAFLLECSSVQDEENWAHHITFVPVRITFFMSLWWSSNASMISQTFAPGKHKVGVVFDLTWRMVSQ